MHRHRRRRRETQPGGPLHVHWHLGWVLLWWVVLMWVLLPSVLLRWMLLHRNSLCRRHTLHLRLFSTWSLLHRRHCRHSGRTGLLIGSTRLLPIVHFYVRNVGTRHCPALPSRASDGKENLVQLDIRSSINIAHAAFDDCVGRLLQCDYHCCAYEVRHGSREAAFGRGDVLWLVTDISKRYCNWL